MSKNIVIQEGGVGKQLTVDKIKTDLVGGGTCLWVPEDEVQLTTKSITEDGAYKASDEGAYGYSQVTVHGIGRVTGKDPQTGQEKTITTDPTTGEIVETVVPTEIRVITPPANPGETYIDGQTITKDGMVVKAYDALGNEMQTVPIGEITINPTVAVFDPDSATEESESASIEDTTGLDDRTIAAMPFTFGDNISFTGIYNTGTQSVPGPGLGPMVHISPVYIFTNHNNGFDYVYACSRDSFSGILYTYNRNGNYNYSFNSSYHTINGNPVYVATLQSGAHFDSCSPSLNHFDGSSTEAAYVILYGTHVVQPAASVQNITVSWPRTGDGAILETNFNINVTGGDAP